LFEGTIEPDGTLVLDGPTNLPPGRVVVAVQHAGEASNGDWWGRLQDGRRQLEVMNYPTMTAQEARSHVEWLRGDDDRIEEVYREIEEHRRREQAG
jgi:hypothetical protein